jgi:hypothetical protein
VATDLSFSIEINGIQKTITSTAEASKVIKELTKNFVELSKAGKDVSQTLLQIGQANKIKDQLVQVGRGAVQMQQGMQGAQTASANASMALLNLNYVIRDSPYFFNNFALGVLAVGNNINPLIDSFNRLRTEAVGKSISTFQLLKQALVGGAGISIAFSLVVTAIQSFVFWQSKSSRESENTTDKLKKEREEVSKLRSEYDGLVRDRELGKKDNTSLEELDRLRKLKSIVQRTVNSYKEELAPLRRTDTINYQEISANLKAEQYQLNRINKEIDFILFAWQKVADENEKDNKKLKEKRTIITGMSADLEAVSKKINFFGEAKYKGQDVRNSLGDVVNRKSVSSSVGNKEGAFQIGKGIKDLDTNLELGKIAAQELGNAISSAFEQGTISLNKFINSLIAAITKMLILRAVTAFLTGGGSAVASVATATAGVGIPSGAGFDATKFNKPMNNVNIQGKISVNKNKFVIDIENATQSYNNNAKLVTIGRD